MDSRSVPATTIVGFGLVEGGELPSLQLVSKNRSRVVYSSDWAGRFHMVYERSLMLDLAVIIHLLGFGIRTKHGGEKVQLRLHAWLAAMYFCVTSWMGPSLF